MSARFAIIVVSYNAGERLEATLDSIFSQTETSLCVLVKDAGSTDGSVAEAERRYGGDSRIRFIVSRDAGIYDGMNQALEACLEGDVPQAPADVPGASGQAKSPPMRLICFLNCGDLFADAEVLARVRAFAEADRAACGGSAPETIYYGDIIERMTGQRVAANPVMDAFACFRNVPCHQACFYDASLLERERFETKWRVRADYEHFLRCRLRREVRTRAMGFVICSYEGGGFSETPEGKRISRAEHREITKRYFTGGQIVRYRAYMVLTLQPLRHFLAANRCTSGLYNRIRGALLDRIPGRRGRGMTDS